MIHYQLRCADGHPFEGWFRDSGAFEDQARRGLLSCPSCGATAIERGLMAPSVKSSRGVAQQAVVLPDQARAALQRLRADIERQCDDVGDRFADAARRLHGQAPPAEGPAPRGIYGQASETERQALAEDGIEIMRIPWLPRADS